MVLSFTVWTAFDHGDGIETTVAAEFPSDMDTAFDTEGDDFDSDYDPTEEGHIGHQGSVGEAPTHPFPERVVKAYLVKYTSYKTSVVQSSCIKSKALFNRSVACVRSSGIFIQER